MRHPTPESSFENAPSDTIRGRVPRLPLVTAAIWSAVIPAKAGIDPANLRRCAMDGLDSRPSPSSGQAFRGNDRRFVRDDIPNDTTTQMTSLPSFGQDVGSEVDLKKRIL